MRRWLKQEWQRRERQRARSRERVQFTDRPEVKRAMVDAMFDLTTQSEKRFANEYSREFLDSQFTVEEGGDTVTMAQASMAQHIRRAEFLEDLAAGNAATAVLHRRIVSDLRDSGSDTLEEMLHDRG